MRKYLLHITLGVVLWFGFAINNVITAQDFKDPGQYIGHINKSRELISRTYLAYNSAASHGKSLRKVEKRREEVINSILEGRVGVTGMPPFNGDKTLKDAAYRFLLITYNVLREDYAKLVNMEEIAEQSYDKMEAYLMAKEMAEKKMQEAGAKLNATIKEFAAKNNVRLIDDGENDVEQKMKKANEVGDYYNELYLLFFKSYKQEMYLTDAVNKGNIPAIEQNKNALASFTNEGLQKIANMAAFNGDESVKQACKAVLEFYRKEDNENIPQITDFFLKEQSFKETKKIFESKPSGKRTQADADNYNKAVSEMNAAANSFNKINEELNKNREKVLNNWEKAVKDFFDEHMPYFKNK